MGQLSQLVLLASIVASCISHSIPSIKTWLSNEPESDFPTEFMNKLIASLSPEKLKALFTPIILTESSLADRYGNAKETPCLSYDDIRNYNIVKATDNQQYYVITNLTETFQPVVHHACDTRGPNGNKCEPSDPYKLYGYCCRQHKIKGALYVIPVPKNLLDVRDGHLFLKGTNDKYEDFTMIQKDVMMNSYCSCDRSLTSIKMSYSCPNPESEIFI